MTSLSPIDFPELNVIAGIFLRGLMAANFGVRMSLYTTILVSTMCSRPVSLSQRR
eukprot:CAMPEP_0177580380 /NCGR_PEP_ID=MMETSP0419_2-20121207/1524_1 /TAXON_ID=582737 /ORGANISM="Tetraselmis sp., Strain GSL018" /LENGTH=54 /DNA_ID=CAMNT_0019069233 /DNA_START=568 /DNA_END=729 /DNA_ORIENTATION=-